MPIGAARSGGAGPLRMCQVGARDPRPTGGGPRTTSAHSAHVPQPCHLSHTPTNHAFSCPLLALPCLTLALPLPSLAIHAHLPAWTHFLSPPLQANRQLRELREIAKGVTKQLPSVVQNATAKIDEYARGMISGTGRTRFEELGCYYSGPVDGHNLQDLIDVLSGG